ncbi:MAG: glycoside hydrolase family 2 TIM barrel-domain containing protein [Anaerohalosphaeraceae bacterium]
MYYRYLGFCSVCFLSLVLLSGAAAEVCCQRLEQNLDSGWRFFKGDAAGAEKETFDDSAWPQIDVPHTWNALDGQDGGNNYYRGAGWYRKFVFIPNEYRGRCIYLYFESVAKAADVYCNGTFIGRHEGAYSAFCLEITQSVRFGAENLIAVKADNSSSLLIAPLSGDFTQWGGICRSVRLLITDPIHITPLDFASPGVYLTPLRVSRESAELQIRTLLRNAGSSDREVTVRAIIQKADETTAETLTLTKKVPAQTTTECIQNAVLSNPHLWEGRKNPYLYRVKLEVEAEQVLRDCIEQPLGLRFFSVDPQQGFLLNGHPYDLHGAAIHEDRQDKGRAVSDADRAEDIEMMLQMGCTWLRLAHYQHGRKIYDLADEKGIILWTEIPLVNSISAEPAFAENCRQQLRELIRQNYNHPSVFFWGIFNEITMVRGPEPTPLIKELHQLAKSEDPSRLTAAAANSSNTHPTTYVTDVIAFNKYFGWYHGTAEEFSAWADEIHAQRNRDCIGISEYGAGAGLSQHEEAPAPPRPDGPWHPEEYQGLYHEIHWNAMKTRPFLWCKTVWNGFDFGADGRAEGEQPGINDKGLVSRDRTVKKDAYYWYQANWSDEPMVYITSRRFVSRQDNPVSVKVYSNCEKAELFVNGRSEGVRSGLDRIFRWEKVVLKSGRNEIKAVGRKNDREYTDVCFWEFSPPEPSLTVKAVSASGFQDGNPPEHTIDGKLSTRWAVQGKGAWIQYDLGTVQKIQKVQIAFYRGKTRRAYLDISVSDDGVSWRPVLTGAVSSGNTEKAEEFIFPETSARYLRILANGTTEGDWNSYCEVKIFGLEPDRMNPPAESNEQKTCCGI